MQRRTLSRTTGVCLAALSGCPAAQRLPFSQARIARQSLRLSALPTTLPSRLLGAAPRFYSSEASAAAVAAEETERPLGPITRFADLSSLGVHDDIVSAIVHGMKYETMSDVQAMTLAPALAGKDIVAQAKTGTGKTLAFVLPVIQKLISSKGVARRMGGTDDIRAIVISPTRELAEQIAAEAKQVARRTGISVQVAVGGTQKSMMLQRARQQGCDLLVATPGRLLDLLSDPRSGVRAPNLEALVLDEADRMLEVGFSQSLSDILNLLPNPAEKSRQTLLYSATLPKDVVKLARSYINPKNFEFCQTIQADDIPTHEKVPQFIVPCSGYENIIPAALEMFYREIDKAKNDADALPFKAIVFLPTTALVQMTYETLQNVRRRQGRLPQVFHIHSKLSQQQRTRISRAFKDAESAILVSSDVTARGMHFPNVSHVVQLWAPPNGEQYIHRVGRTGRADKSGQGWLFVPARAARWTMNRLLADLPLQQVNDIKSASFNGATSEPRPEAFEDVTAASKMVPAEVLSEAYTSVYSTPSFTQAGADSRDIAEAMNQWSTLGWGMEKPPAVSAFWARKNGLSGMSSMNIGRPATDENYGGRRDAFGKGDSRSSGFGDRDSGRGGYGSRGRDMGRSGGRDGRGESGGRGFGRGGFGGNRSNRGGLTQGDFGGFEGLGGGEEAGGNRRHSDFGRRSGGGGGFRGRGNEGRRTRDVYDME